MRIVALQEPQDHDISLRSAAALCGALLLGALAVMSEQSATAQGPCTAIADDAERLACYDRALRAAPPPAATPPPATEAPPRDAPPAVTATPPRSERRIRESTAPTARAAPAAPSAGGNAAEAQQVIPIVVVNIRALPGRETTFTAEDGTSWRQTDSQRIVGLPDTPFEAEIKPGAMGSYFLVAKDRARAIRVRPIR
jgi:hypothetical protein